jgi:F420-dependent methylenetetrahydromethanopterin dehydrogenase
VLFEETQKTLLCSDLFHQTGDVEPLTSADVVGRSHKAMKEYQLPSYNVQNDRALVRCQHHIPMARTEATLGLRFRVKRAAVGVPAAAMVKKVRRRSVPADIRRVLSLSG